MTEPVPHLLGGVRRDQRQQDRDCLDRLAHRGVRRPAAPGVPRLVDGLAGGVDQLHGPGHHHVEPVTLDQLRGLVQGPVGGSTQRDVAALRGVPGLGGDVPGQAPGSLEELRGAAG